MIYSLLLQKKKAWMFLVLFCQLSFIAFGQAQIQGKITASDDQMPVIGASVKIKGSVTGTVTNVDGGFSIMAQPRDILVISYLGYQTQEITVGNQNNLALILMPALGTLDEVLVTGYASERKKDITGSVAVVDMRNLKSIPAGSAVSALQGQASGVNVISSGLPGSDSKVLVRGVSSFGNTNPLVLIDGVEGDLNNIISNDIESIQVLKDGGAAAIYGVRGSNGVIIVTTKKGASGQAKFTYDTYYGIQSPLSGNPFNIINNVQDFANVVNISNPNNGLFKNGIPDFLYGGAGGSGVAMAGDTRVDPGKYNLDLTTPSKSYLIQEVNKSGTNWFQELFDIAPMTNHSISASGGSDKSNYLISLGYIDQQGTLIETYMKRYSARINTSIALKKNIRIGQNTNIYYRDSPAFDNQEQFGTLANVYRMMPIIPVYDIKGNFGGTFSGPELGAHNNPVAIQKRTANDRNKSWNIMGNAYAEADFMSHFTARTSIGGTVNNYFIQNFTFTPYEASQGNANPNNYAESANYRNNLTWTNSLTYLNTFGNHNLRLLAGSESVMNTGRGLSSEREKFISSNYNYLILDNGTSNVKNSSSAYRNTLFSLFSRADYSYKDKYLLGATIRRDGSSQFGSNNRYGIFPSFSLGWRVSNESFMKGITWIDDLKFRGSYGILGSQNNVAADNAFSLYGGGYADAYYDIRGTSQSIVQGFYQTRIGNDQTGWERNIISNIGFDASILNNKVNLSIEYYKKSIDGLLFTQPLPGIIGGAAAPIVNIGDIQNKGWDASINYFGNIGKEFKFSVGTIFTSYKNKVMSIPGTGFFDVANINSLGNMVRNEMGQTVSSFYGYQVIGLFSDAADVTNSPTQTGAGPGRFKYKDISGDKIISTNDRTSLGSPNPDFTYGLNLGLNFKNFDFATNFYGSQGNEAVNSVRAFTDFFGEQGAKSNVLLNAWTPTNMNTTIPKIEQVRNFSTNGVMNSYFVEDASYFRLRSLILGYTIKPKTLSKAGLSGLRVYVQGTNLFTLTKYTGLDPELGGNSSNFGIDYGNYPNNQKNFLLGLNVSF